MAAEGNVAIVMLFCFVSLTVHSTIKVVCFYVVDQSESFHCVKNCREGAYCHGNKNCQETRPKTFAWMLNWALYVARSAHMKLLDDIGIHFNCQKWYDKDVLLLLMSFCAGSHHQCSNGMLKNPLTTKFKSNRLCSRAQAPVPRL